MLPSKKLQKALIAATASLVFFVCSGESNARAACSEALNNYGYVFGNTITSVFFWGPQRSDAGALARGWSGVVNDPGFYSRVNEYGVQGGSYGTFVPTVAGYPTGALAENTIQQGVYYALQNAYFNYIPHVTEVFLVFLPNGTYATVDANNNQAAHHWYFSARFPDGNTYNVVYAVIEYMANLDQTNYFISHELYESYTDPYWTIDGNNNFFGFGVWDGSTSMWSRGNAREIGDMCQNGLGGTPSWSGYGTTMSQVWSQNLCGCH
jgi:hypothetical protein